MVQLPSAPTFRLRRLRWLSQRRRAPGTPSAPLRPQIPLQQAEIAAHSASLLPSPSITRKFSARWVVPMGSHTAAGNFRLR